MYWRIMWKLVLYCSFHYCLVCEEHNVTITRVGDGDVITADDDVFKLDCSQIQGSKEHLQTSCKCEKNRSIFHQYPNQTYGCYHFQTFCKGCNYIGNVTYIKKEKSLIVSAKFGLALFHVLVCLLDLSSKKKISQWEETAWNELTDKLTAYIGPGFVKISLLYLNHSLQGRLIWLELQECPSINVYNYLLKVNGYEKVTINISITRQPSSSPPTTTTTTTTTTSTTIKQQTTTTTSTLNVSPTTTMNTQTTSTPLTTTKRLGIIKDEEGDGNIVEIIVPIVVVVFMVVAVIIFICCRKSKNDNHIRTMNMKSDPKSSTYDNKSMNVDGQEYDDVAIISRKTNDSNTLPSSSYETLQCKFEKSHYNQLESPISPANEQEYDDVAMKSRKTKDSNTVSSSSLYEPLQYKIENSHYQQLESPMKLAELTNSMNCKAPLSTESSAIYPTYEHMYPITDNKPISSSKDKSL